MECLLSCFICVVFFHKVNDFLTADHLMHNMQEALKRRLNARIEYAKFLQDTVKEMAKEVQVSRSGELKKTAEDLDEFLNKVNTIIGIITPLLFFIFPFCSL